MTELQKIEQRVAELEMKTTFQEHTIEQLNQALVEQQFMVDKLQVQLRHIALKLSDMRPSNIASQAEETPPPHY